MPVQKLLWAFKLFILQGSKLGIVIGGGNIFRGIHASDLDLPKTPADHMGMFATMINGIALKHALQAIGCPARVFSGLDCPKAVESYNWARAHECFDAGEVLIFVGGTGNPYFTTDTAAALRASEIEADLVMKATKVEGVYDKDPVHHPEAEKFQTLTYDEVLSRELKVMDATAIALCRGNKIPILVFHMDCLSPGRVEDLEVLKSNGTYIEE